MAVKTFITGEKLTTSDTNTFLNNGGLVYITETSFSGQTGVNIDNCFTSVMANYRMVVDLSAVSANDVILFQWRTGGSSGSTYGTADYDFQLAEFFGGSSSPTAGMGSTWARIGYAYATPGYFSATYDLINPQASFRAAYTGTGWSPNGTTFILTDQIAGQNRVTTSFTGIRISNLAGSTTMTGRIKIYGYRNA